MSARSPRRYFACRPSRQSNAFISEGWESTMAERGTATSKPSEKSFGEFLKAIPTAAEAAKTVRLVGTIHRGEKEGEFTLTLQNGHSVSLTAEDVTSFTVVSETPTLIVQ